MTEYGEPKRDVPMTPEIETLSHWYRTMDYERCLAADIDWEMAERFPEAGRTKGRENVRAMFARFFERFSDWAIEVEEMIPSDARVVVVGTYSGTAKATGRSFVVPYCHIWTFANGRMARVRHFANTALMNDALEPLVA